MVGIIEGRVMRLDEFIQDILDYSRNARMALNKENVLVEDFLHLQVEGLRYLEGMERIHIKVLAPPSFQVFTDPKRLKIIVNNLLTNSIRYADHHKQNPFITIEAREEKQRLEPSGE